MSGRQVICLESEERFPSIRAAASSVGRSVASMRRALDDGSTCGGHHFYFADGEKPPRRFFRHKKPLEPKPVCCLETEQVFPSVCSAAREYGLRSA